MSVDAEKAVLGSMILDPDCVCLVADKINSNMFTDERRAKLYADILKLNSQDNPIDPVTLKNMGSATPFIVDVMESVPSAASVEYYADILIESHSIAQILMTAKKIEYICSGQGLAAEKIEKANQELQNLSGTARKNENTQHIRDIQATFEKSEESHLLTQFDVLNNLILGFKRTDMIVIAGQPGMGKTSLMLDFCTHYGLDQKIPAAFMSLEMTAEQLKQRMVCSRCEVPLKAAMQGFIGQEQRELIGEAVKQFDRSQIYISKQAGLTPSKLKRQLAMLKRRHGIKIAFVDYLQLMRSETKGTKYETMTDISRSIKEIAVDLEIPIVIGSQLNRGVDNREDKRPGLSDLRDTGAIEEDADMVMGLYRGSWYTKTEDHTTELVILKGREFGTGTVDLKFVPELTKFKEKIGGLLPANNGQFWQR